MDNFLVCKPPVAPSPPESRGKLTSQGLTTEITEITGAVVCMCEAFTAIRVINENCRCHMRAGPPEAGSKLLHLLS